MKNLLRSAIIVTIVLFAPGCASTDSYGVSHENYRAAIEQIRSNLADHIKPTVQEVFAGGEMSQIRRNATMDLMSDTLTLCDDTLAGKNAGAAAVASGQ